MTRLGELLKTNKKAKAIELIGLFLIALPFIAFLTEGASANLIVNQALIWVANIIMLGYVWTGMYLRGERWTDFGLSFKRPSWKDIYTVFLWSLLVFVLAVLGFIVGSIIMANITGIPESSNMSSYDYLKDNVGMLILTLLGVYIVSSFGEEVIYRGFLINRFIQLGWDTKWGRILAVLLSAIVFGFAHFSWGPMGIVQTAFMGLALGLCYIYLKKRLWILILAHLYMDTILMVQLYLANSASG
jgi:membrane protease YdiL (CAAX protease family)